MACSTRALQGTQLQAHPRKLTTSAAPPGREKVASHDVVQPAAPQPGPDALARLATQFRSKHEELQRALERVQDVVASKPGAGDTHKLLVDAVDVSWAGSCLLWDVAKAPLYSKLD